MYSKLFSNCTQNRTQNCTQNCTQNYTHVRVIIFSIHTCIRVRYNNNISTVLAYVYKSI